MREITVRDNGINWIWYHIVQLDDVNATAKIIKSWRAHKFENRGHHPKGPLANADIFRNNCDIRRWMDDGKPGGLDGLKANYRKPDAISIWTGSNINATVYILEK